MFFRDAGGRVFRDRSRGAQASVGYVDYGYREGCEDAAVTIPGPRSGEDTFDLIDDAVAALADRRGVWVGDDLSTIALIASLIEQAERWLPQLVHDTRANGHDWTKIARALGTSPDEARLRFDPDSPIADGRWPYNH
jgi:hypothetical protein